MAGPIDMGAEFDDSDLRRMLNRLEKKLGDLRPFFYDEVDRTVTDFFTKQFETKGEHGGARWAPLAPLTLKLRARAGHGRGGAGAILWDLGAMRLDFLNATGTGFRRVTKIEYQRGAINEVAALHQTGWMSQSVFGQPRRRPVRVPARPVVPETLPRSLTDQWTSRLTTWLEALT